ncbi:hypothetical protein PUN28_008820 [Cardiocondyla obscurior]|uniref:Uncharacterized protein n=1 Tax=Cardiocondyla obscurior TaxID=286306 RepID=A0AAW2FUV0_9HYME
MTSRTSRCRYNYISLLGIPCRINCIVSACPLCESRVSGLGDISQPLRLRCPRAHPLCFMFHPFSCFSYFSSTFCLNLTCSTSCCDYLLYTSFILRKRNSRC